MHVNANVGHTSFSSLLGLLFIGLKLGNFIDWSWLWVLAPLWIPPFLLLAFCLSVLTSLLVAWFVDSRKKKKARAAANQSPLSR